MGKPQRQLRVVQATCLLVLGACNFLLVYIDLCNRPA